MMTIKTPMRFPGAKHALFAKKIVPMIRSYISAGCTYVEPFSGGLSTVCGFVNHFSPSRLVVNDLDPAVHALYQCVADKHLFHKEKDPVTANGRLLGLS